MMKKGLPIGIQTFSEIRTDNMYYVDKTEFAHRLIENGKYYFLSRPRRFGKSLFVDTLKELFEGNKALFEGLFIHDKWDWSRKYPVIRISFSDGNFNSPEKLNQRICEILAYENEKRGFSPRNESIAGLFEELIRNTHKNASEKVVILIDEYEKPILDNIDDANLAGQMRDALKNLYSIIKGADAHLRFAFLTGVSKFSKVSLFSGLNNLVDITLDKKFSAICGYTEQDLDTVFAHELDGLDRALVKEWYNGYNWLGEAVYNPFDLLLLFRDREFRSYWFETGNPSFLIKLLLKREFFLPELSKVYSSDRLLSTFDVDRIATEALLFQTGYLTIKAHRFVPGKIEIELGYPNREVKAALNECLMDALVHYEAGLEKSRRRMEEMFLQQNIQGMGELVKSLFASIPYQWYVNNQIAHYEGYYASVFYAYFTSMGLDVVAEESSNVGRLDMGLRHGSAVYLFEFKVVEENSEGTALTQIEQNDYAEKYRGEDVTIYSIGVEFSKAKRQIVTWDWKKENGKQLTESKT